MTDITLKVGDTLVLGRENGWGGDNGAPGQDDAYRYTATVLEIVRKNVYIISPRVVGWGKPNKIGLNDYGTWFEVKTDYGAETIYEINGI